MFDRDLLVLDGHTDVPTRLWEEPADLTTRAGDRHVDLPRLRKGGVDGLVFALFVPVALSPAAGLEHVKTLHRLAAERLAPGRLEQAESAEQIRRNARRGAVSVLFGLENGRPLTLPGALEQVARLGVRYVTLTHVSTHEWCDASTDEPQHDGLAPEGIEIIRELNRRAILADVSHVSDSAVEQVLAVATAPVIASHSSARALCDHPRNLPDNLVRDIARQGGVVMANSYPAFLAPQAARANERRAAELGPDLAELGGPYLRDPRKHWREVAELMASHPLPPVDLGVYVDHILHLIEVAGE
ncbi:MAG TPA: membrane dipeptidase, partial [Thermoanaerobaculia bacterium]|nr:membrane dipeptidase [Thermoanaerobaculia bacterium]